MRSSARTLLIVALVLVTGCTKAPAHPSASPTSTEPPPLVPPNADYGGVEGYVFGPDQLPLANATVTLHGTNLTALTDASGYYAILPIPPGNYKLEANATKHVPLTRNIALGAGMGIRADFTLVEIPNPQPYIDASFQRRGQIQCTFRANAQGTNTNPSCSDVAKDQTSGALPPTQGANFTVQPGIMGLLVEVQWTPSVPTLNDKLRLAVRISEADTWKQFEGPSVLRVELGPGQLAELGTFAEKNYTQEGGRFVLNLYPGETASNGGAAAGATFQQDYTMYATVFYREAPVPGYSRVPPS